MQCGGSCLQGQCAFSGFHRESHIGLHMMLAPFACSSCSPGAGCVWLQEIAPEFVENQKKVDGPLLKALSPELRGYLAARFTLKAHDRPHLMKF